MLFSDSIPEEVLLNPNTSMFVSVLDKLQESKQGIIDHALRGLNPLLCTDTKWLVKYLDDFGLSGVPEYIPVACLQQLALNMGEIFSRIGTEEGLKLLLETMVLGTANIEYGLTPEFEFLLPDSIFDGIITSSSSVNDRRYLVDRNTLNELNAITVKWESRVFNSDIPLGTTRYDNFIEFAKLTIGRFIGFHPNTEILISTATASKYVYSGKLNDYFKNT